MTSSPYNIKEKSIPKHPISTHNQRKEIKMARTKNRIKKMIFQTQERTLHYEPLSDDDKYIIEMAGYQKLIGRQHENISRTPRRSSRPQHI